MPIQTSLIAHYRMNDNAASAVVVDESGNHDGEYQIDGVAQNTSTGASTGKINGAIDFVTASKEHVEVGDTESDVKSIAIWINPDAVNVTDYLIDLNGTDYITIVNGTVTKNGFATGTQIIYVDNIVASTVTANWHLIVLTSTVGFDANDLEIARLSGSGYFNGLIDNVMLFNKVLTLDEKERLFNNGYGTEILAEAEEPRLLLKRNNSPFGLRSR